MANENATNVTENNVANNATEKTETVEQLKAQLAQVNAEKEQLKNSLTKSNSEAAGYKKALREKQTAEEAEAEAKAEAEKLQKEELEALRKELNYNKALSAYKTISDDGTIQRLIDAVSNADHNAIAAIIEKECKVAVSNAETTWLNNRPRVNAGVEGSGAMTKQDIKAIKDPIERQRKIAENIHLFNGGN